MQNLPQTLSKLKLVVFLHSLEICAAKATQYCKPVKKLKSLSHVVFVAKISSPDRVLV